MNYLIFLNNQIRLSAANRTIIHYVLNMKIMFIITNTCVISMFMSPETVLPLVKSVGGGIDDGKGKKPEIPPVVFVLAV